MKAVISNRIYLNVDEELKKKLMAELTYKIPKKYVKGSKMKQYEIIRTYKNISPTIMSIPAGRLDLVPEHYEIVDKRIHTEEYPFPVPLLQPREDQAVVIRDASGNSIINAQPGWGKTFTALLLAHKLGQPTLVVCHTTQLRDQWIEEAKKMFGIDVGIIGGGEMDIDDHILCIGNVQTVTKFSEKLAKHFGTLILDEMHHVSAETFRDIIDNSYARYKIGLSGTLNRTDGKHVLFRDYFGTEIHQPSQNNILDPTIELYNTGVWLEPGGNWATKVNKLLYDEDYQAMIALIAAREIGKGEKVLILADRVEFLENVTELLNGACLCITGKVDDYEERKRLLQEIYDGTKQAIAGSRQIFTEGISVNPLSCLIIATPTANPILLEQAIGRIQRLCEGKFTCKVIDIGLGGPDGRKHRKERVEFYQRKGWDIKEYKV